MTEIEHKNAAIANAWRDGRTQADSTLLDFLLPELLREFPQVAARLAAHLPDLAKLKSKNTFHEEPEIAQQVFDQRIAGFVQCAKTLSQDPIDIPIRFGNQPPEAR